MRRKILKMLRFVTEEGKQKDLKDLLIANLMAIFLECSDPRQIQASEF